ncbi:fimbrial protein [Novosphingobium flavum]|uniref:Fimbrial protein n=1 Tax=Novosphingobium flavum TaxID=1778672 RepID=A0A7X1KMN2_9SPHN|nr:fimbrial protein [Novosphingobium flavum]MBC2666809.1 fimbrial protein [Novosphingobium flavum]
MTQFARLLSVLGSFLLMLLASVPAHAISLQFAPAALALSPGGPYSSARDKPVGTVIATASSTLSATDISALGCAVTALMLSGSPASGNTFTTGVAGLGVNLYYTSGGSRIQITPGIQASIIATLGGPGTVTAIEADLIVTGQVGSGTMSSLPSVTVTFLAAGLGCGVLNLGLKTLTVTATDATVAGLSCTVTTPSLSVALPRVSASTLASAGTTAGATRLRVGLNCASTGANVYVTFTDANNAANRTTSLSLGASSTASNVAIQLLRDDGNLVAYGPDSAATGNTNQLLVGPSASVTGIPLTARYVATGAATPGSVSAAATFTMSYQ